MVGPDLQSLLLAHEHAHFLVFLVLQQLGGADAALLPLSAILVEAVKLCLAAAARRQRLELRLTFLLRCGCVVLPAVLALALRLGWRAKRGLDSAAAKREAAAARAKCRRRAGTAKRGKGVGRRGGGSWRRLRAGTPWQASEVSRPGGATHAQCATTRDTRAARRCF
eukprot:365263-Chlamydomonas_euryale.AAC.3